MRHTEFWARMQDAVGPAFYEVWSEQFVMSDLGGRTVRQALDAGVPPKEVWASVWRVLELPERDR